MEMSLYYRDREERGGSHGELQSPCQIRPAPVSQGRSDYGCCDGRRRDNSPTRRRDPGPCSHHLPSTKLVNVKDLKVDAPVQIQYPDKDSPGVIIKLGRKVEGGVGPDGDIVAFSTLCPHKGFPLGYVATDKTLNCPGHYSRFDCERGGQEIWGHATQNLPQFRLVVAGNGDIFAEGADELIYGRLSNTLTA